MKKTSIAVLTGLLASTSAMAAPSTQDVIQLLGQANAQKVSFKSTVSSNVPNNNKWVVKAGKQFRSCEDYMSGVQKKLCLYTGVISNTLKFQGDQGPAQGGFDGNAKDGTYVMLTLITGTEMLTYFKASSISAAKTAYSGFLHDLPGQVKGFKAIGGNANKFQGFITQTYDAERVRSGYYRFDMNGTNVSCHTDGAIICQF